MPLNKDKMKQIKKSERAMSIKISNDEYEKFEKICKHYNITKTEALRQFIIQEYDYLKEKYLIE